MDEIISHEGLEQTPYNPLIKQVAPGLNSTWIMEAEGLFKAMQEKFQFNSTPASNLNSTAL